MTPPPAAGVSGGLGGKAGDYRLSPKAAGPRVICLEQAPGLFDHLCSQGDLDRDEDL